MNKHRCEKLAEKLLLIRMKLHLTQANLLARLNAPKTLTEDDIADYETGAAEPPLLLLLAYAKLAGVCTDILIDDKRKLPRKLPDNMRC